MVEAAFGIAQQIAFVVLFLCGGVPGDLPSREHEAFRLHHFGENAAFFRFQGVGFHIDELDASGIDPESVVGHFQIDPARHGF